jgi:opacity protein-like surface antigen
MKLKLLMSATALMFASEVSAACWNGFYVRTDLAVMGNGKGYKKTEDEALVAAGRSEGSSARSMYLGVAGGWGKVFGGSFYGGIDATLLGMSGAMSTGDKNEFSFVYDPKATVRLGFARCNLMFYVGVGMGALWAFTDTAKLQGPHADFPKNKEGKNDLLWTWHGRIGADFKIKGNWSAGVFYEYQRSIANANEGDTTTKLTDVSLISDRLAFTFGFQM